MTEPRDWSDAEVVAGCRDGRDDAWRELHDRFGRLVFSIPRRAGLDTASAEDVYQEVFSAFLKRVDDIHSPAAIRHWLMTTTYNLTRRTLRRTRPVVEPPADIAAPGDPPGEDLVRWEQQHLVRQGLRRLGGRCEKLLTALYMRPGKVSYAAIAADLGMPEGSIGPTRARCLVKLAEILEKAR